MQGSDPFFLYGLYTSAGVRVFINLVLVLGCIVKYFIAEELLEGQSPIVLFKIGTFCKPFLALGIAHAQSHISVGLRRWGGNISVKSFCLFYTYNTNFMNKLLFNDF